MHSEHAAVSHPCPVFATCQFFCQTKQRRPFEAKSWYSWKQMPKGLALNSRIRRRKMMLPDLLMQTINLHGHVVWRTAAASVTISVWVSALITAETAIPAGQKTLHIYYRDNPWTRGVFTWRQHCHTPRHIQSGFF